MWKKPENTESDNVSSTPPSRPSSSSGSGPARGGERAVIGPSISIRGDVTGEEDLLIQGKVDGKVDLQQNNVTIGEHGTVKADLFGRNLTVEGKVEGNLFGEERVVVRSSGQVIGNITSPRVHLEDGATFKGSIDMDSKGGRRSASGSTSTSSSSSASSSSSSSSGNVSSGRDTRSDRSSGSSSKDSSSKDSSTTKPAVQAG